MMEFQCLEDIRDYLKKETKQDPCCRVHIKLKKRSDLEWLREKGLYLLFFHSQEIDVGKEPDEVTIFGSLFGFSLLLEEYEIAQSLLQTIECISIAEINGFPFMIYLGVTSFAGVYIEKILYNSKCPLPPGLKECILKRIQEEADDLWLFSIKAVKEINHQEVCSALQQDMIQYSDLFDRISYQCNSDLSYLALLFQIFKNNDEKTNDFLLFNKGCFEKFSSNQGVDVEKQKEYLQTIYSSLQNRPNTTYRFFYFLLQTLTNLRIYFANTTDEKSIKMGVLELEEMTWDMLKKIPVDKEMFEFLRKVDMQHDKRSIHIEIFLESAALKFGEKQVLVVSYQNLDSIYSFFYFSNEYTNRKLTQRIFQLLQNVSRIEYEEDALTREERTQKLVGFLIHNADILGESSELLLQKGFIPDTYLDDVFQSVLNEKDGKLEYMYPLLIQQKYRRKS